MADITFRAVGRSFGLRLSRWPAQSGARLFGLLSTERDMALHYMDDQMRQQPEAAHAASEFDAYEPQPRRWSFSTREQTAETLADWFCIAVVVGAVAWAVFA